MRRGDRKATDAAPTLAPGETGKPPKRGRLPQFDYLSVDGLAKTLGGKAKLMNIARMSSDEHVRGVIAHWDAIHVSKQPKASLDETLDACGVEPSWFVGKVAEVAHAHGVETTKLMVSLCSPAVVSKNIEVAMTDDGFKDRELFLKGAGFVPTAQGSQNNFAFLLGSGGMVPQVEQVAEPKQIEGSSDIPRVEDHNIIDAVFRDLDGEDEVAVISGASSEPTA